MATFQKRGSRWRAIIRKTGYKPTSKTFQTKAQAQRWAIRTESEMDRAAWKDPALLSERSVSWLVEQYRSAINPSRAMDTALRHFDKSIGEMTLSRLNALEIAAYIRERAEKDQAAPATLSLELVNLGSLLKFAANYHHLPAKLEELTQARQLLKDEELIGRPQERTRRPTEQELVILFSYWNSARYLRGAKLPMQDIVSFAISTSMRLGEICRLRWEDLNEADKTIVIRDRKHPSKKRGNHQEVPLLGEAWEILERQPRKGVRVFPFDARSVSTNFTRTCLKTGVRDLRFHDLRHEGVSRLFEQGYTIEQVSLVSGHRDWSMLRRYVQLRAKDLHR